MKTDQQNPINARYTIFKPPRYIYKLSKYPTKNNQKLQYETYFNQEYSLRKYNRTISIGNQTELALYEWRKHTTCPVISVVYLQLINRTISSMTSQTGAIEVNVYTEHIEKLLADMINLTLTEAIYVLKQCLCAYQELFSKFSAVSISKFYCGLNAQGQLKLWINENFSLNCNVQRSPDNQHTYNEVLIVEPAIVNKITHMVGLLANASCKSFFYGLDKELSIKRFSFNNCLQYINSFVSNTKNLEIPTNLNYMLPKRNSFGLDRSNVKFLNNTRFKTLNNQRKDTYSSNLTNNNSFKQFASFVRLGNRQSVQKQNCQNHKKTDQNNQNKFRFKRYSQQLSSNYVHSRLPSKVENKPFYEENSNVSKNQCKISLQMIVERSRKNSIKSNELFAVRKSNISLQKQRPSICIVPTFISKSTRGDNAKENIKSHEKEREKSQKSNNSFSIQSGKSKGYNSLVSSKIGSLTLNKFGTVNKQNSLYRTHQPPKIQKLQTEVNLGNIRRSQPMHNIRARSASANLKLGSYGSYEIPERIQNMRSQQSDEKKCKETTSSHHENISRGQKTSTNSISNEGTAKKRSFLTRTNNDSNTDDNEKTQSFCRMDFSSMSIDNKISNKNFDSEVCTTKKQDMKRSLMSYKFGFQQILENPSCKQVEEENETKSYNGSSLRNTQNINDQLCKLQKKNQQTASNNFSFGNSSNRIIKRHLKDSVEENWDLIKEKNEEVLIKNQWKKTINNLGECEQMAVNESIIDTSNEIVRRDKYADVRLDKLDRLGKNMCFSIVNRTEEGTLSLNSSLKRLDAM